MIKINLLPKELRKKRKKIKIPDITLIFLPVAAGVMGILILIHVLLGVTVHFKKRTFDRMDKEWNRILPEKCQVDLLKKEVARIQDKVKAIDQLMVKRILWSRKLNNLSDSMIPGIWLTRLSLDSKKDAGRKFIIEGSASSAYGDETATVGRFIKSLKDNAGFFQDFSGIELDSMQRRVIKEIEVMNFRISCYFKDE